MEVIRKVLWGIVLILALGDVWLFGWHDGTEVGYQIAMADVLLRIETPENYFTKKFDIQIPRRVQQNKEQAK